MLHNDKSIISDDTSRFLVLGEYDWPGKDRTAGEWEWQWQQWWQWRWADNNSMVNVVRVGGEDVKFRRSTKMRCLFGHACDQYTRFNQQCSESLAALSDCPTPISTPLSLPWLDWALLKLFFLFPSKYWLKVAPGIAVYSSLSFK